MSSAYSLNILTADQIFFIKGSSVPGRLEATMDGKTLFCFLVVYVSAASAVGWASLLLAPSPLPLPCRRLFIALNVYNCRKNRRY